MVRYINRLKNYSTIQYLGLWETLNNPNFNVTEFEYIKNYLVFLRHLEMMTTIDLQQPTSKYPSAMLVGGLTQEEFFSGRSMPRNRELMRVFRDMEFVENFGSGIQRILRVHDRSIFQISDNFIITEFKYDPEVLKKVRNEVVHSEPVNVPVNEPVK